LDIPNILGFKDILKEKDWIVIPYQAEGQK